MRTVRAIYHLMRADWLERVRRPSHLLLSASMVFLVYWALRGGLVVQVAGYRSVFNSAWSGLVLALWGDTWLSLVGFYVIKSSVLRDRQTRAGELLAATPISRFAYLLGKCFSNFAVLAGAMGFMLVGAIVLQLLRHESATIEVWPLLSPFLLLALPTLFATAAIAVGFECLPVLSGGVGNVLWVFIWTGLIALPIETHQVGWDLHGVEVIRPPIVASAHAQLPGVPADAFMSMQGGPIRPLDPHHFVWHGLPWTPSLIAQRLLWIGIGLAMVVLATVFFDRFDPARSREVRRGRFARPGDRIARLTLRQPQLPSLSFGNRFATLLMAELRLLLRGHRWWWYLGALGMYIPSVIISPSQARPGLLPALWIWPVLAWSAMGTLESRWGTVELIASSPRAQSRQLPSVWMAGVLVGAMLVSGAALRAALTGEMATVYIAAAGVLLVPAAALALGVLSGTPRAFEALYAAAWYVGPLQHLPALDFAGTTPHPSLQYVPWYLALTGVLLLIAWAGRARRLRV